MKLCIDCKYCQPLTSAMESSKCANPLTKDESLMVAGNSDAYYKWMRRDSSWISAQKTCGQDAKWFEPKEVTQ